VRRLTVIFVKGLRTLALPVRKRGQTLQSGLQQDQYDTGARRRPGACSGVLCVYLMALNHAYVLRLTQRLQG